MNPGGHTYDPRVVANLVIEQLTSDIQALEDTRNTMAATMADLAYENFVLRELWTREHSERIHAEAALRHHLAGRRPAPLPHDTSEAA